jgi:hypothetical protein
VDRNVDRIRDLTSAIEVLHGARCRVAGRDQPTWELLRSAGRYLEQQRQELFRERENDGRQWWRGERPGPTTPMGREESLVEMPVIRPQEGLDRERDRER